MQQHLRALEAVVDIHEAACLLAVAPDLDFVPARDYRHGYLARNRGWRFFAPPVPRAIGAIDVVITRDTGLDPEILTEVTAQSLSEQLLPTIPILAISRICFRFFQSGYVGINLPVGRVNAG